MCRSNSALFGEWMCGEWWYQHDLHHVIRSAFTFCIASSAHVGMTQRRRVSFVAGSNDRIMICSEGGGVTAMHSNERALKKLRSCWDDACKLAMTFEQGSCSESTKTMEWEIQFEREIHLLMKRYLINTKYKWSAAVGECTQHLRYPYGTQ